MEGFFSYMWQSPGLVTASLALLGALWYVANWHGKVNSDRKAFNEFMSYMRDKIDQIFDRLPTEATTSLSPVQLTDLGKQVSKDADAKLWVAEHALDARKQTEGMSPYDVQQFCFSYVSMERFDEVQERKAKDAAFKNGLTISEVLRVVAIELRNELLSEAQISEI